MGKYKAIIMAAGMGKRMNSSIPKALHKIFDKCIIDYVIANCKKAGINDICVIIGHGAELMKEHLKNEQGVTFAIQKEQLGTGHAVMQAVHFIEPDDTILVINGDNPLISGESISDLYNDFVKNNYVASVITAVLDNPFGYGRIVRDESNLFKKIVEQKDTTEQESLIKEVNLGVYMYKGDALTHSLSKLTNNNTQKEYYITDTLYHILKSSNKVGVYSLKDSSESPNVNSREELAYATSLMFKKINTLNMINGVTIVDPLNTYIGLDVTIGKDTIIYPGTMIKGKTTIGSNCVIECSVIENSDIKDGSHIGPFEHIQNNVVK